MDEKPLIESDLPLEHAMLRAASRETVPPAVARRALARLGLLGAVPPVASISATAGAEASAGRATPKWLASRGMTRWAVGLGTAAAVGGAVVLEQVRREPDQVARTTTTESAEPTTETTIRSPVPSQFAPREQTQPLEDTRQTEPHRFVEEVAGVGVVTPSGAKKLSSRSRLSGEARTKPTMGTRNSSSSTTSARALVQHQRGLATTPSTIEPSSARSALAAVQPESAAARAVSIRSEIDLLDRARGALAKGAAGRALAILREYSIRHPHGELQEEAAVVTIEAMRARGSQREAADAARRFKERFPTSAHQGPLQDVDSR